MVVSNCRGFSNPLNSPWLLPVVDRGRRIKEGIGIGCEAIVEYISEIARVVWDFLKSIPEASSRHFFEIRIVQAIQKGIDKTQRVAGRLVRRSPQKEIDDLLTTVASSVAKMQSLPQITDVSHLKDQLIFWKELKGVVEDVKKRKDEVADKIYYFTEFEEKMDQLKKASDLFFSDFTRNNLRYQRYYVEDVFKHYCKILGEGQITETQRDHIKNILIESWDILMSYHDTNIYVARTGSWISYLKNPFDGTPDGIRPLPLKNVGGFSCYIDSAVQALLCIPQIREKLNTNLMDPDPIRLETMEKVRQKLIELANQTSQNSFSFLSFFFQPSDTPIERIIDEIFKAQDNPLHPSLQNPKEVGLQQDSIVGGKPIKEAGLQQDSIVRGRPIKESCRQQDSADIVRLLMASIFNMTFQTQKIGYTSQIEEKIFRWAIEKNQDMMNLVFPDSGIAPIGPDRPDKRKQTDEVFASEMAEFQKKQNEYEVLRGEFESRQTAHFNQIKPIPLKTIIADNLGIHTEHQNKTFDPLDGEGEGLLSSTDPVHVDSYQVTERIVGPKPDVVALGLKRFGFTTQGRARKIRGEVILPQDGIIDLSPYSNEPFRCKINAIIMHSGGDSVNSGHYTCKIRIGDKYYHCDDCGAQPYVEITAEEFHNERNAYIVLLSKI